MHDPDPYLHRFTDFLLVAAIVKDEGMEIAVAGMEHVGHGQVVLFRQRLNFLEDDRKLCPGDDRVLEVTVWTDLAHRGQGCLPTLPEELAFLIVLGDSDLPDPVVLKDLNHEFS